MTQTPDNVLLRIFPPCPTWPPQGRGSSLTCAGRPISCRLQGRRGSQHCHLCFSIYRLTFFSLRLCCSGNAAFLYFLARHTFLCVINFSIYYSMHKGVINHRRLSHWRCLPPAASRRPGSVREKRTQSTERPTTTRTFQTLKIRLLYFPSISRFATYECSNRYNTADL